MCVITDGNISYFFYIDSRQVTVCCVVECPGQAELTHRLTHRLTPLHMVGQVRRSGLQ